MNTITPIDLEAAHQTAQLEMIAHGMGAGIQIHWAGLTPKQRQVFQRNSPVLFAWRLRHEPDLTEDECLAVVDTFTLEECSYAKFCTDTAGMDPRLAVKLVLWKRKHSAAINATMNLLNN